MNEFVKELNKNLIPVYVSKFNLSLHPFSDKFNSTLFYEDDGRKQILKKITHLIDFTKLVLFVQGAEGLGKSTLIRQRIRTAKKSWRTCYFRATDYTNPDALINKIADDMNIKFFHQNADTQLRSLHEQLEALRQTGVTPVLIIDDIEALNPSLIPTLSTLIAHTPDNQPLLRLIIAGVDIPNSLIKTIPKEKKELSLKYLPLPPLTEKDCSKYIKHRLNVSGYEYLEPFNKKTAKKNIPRHKRLSCLYQQISRSFVFPICFRL